MTEFEYILYLELELRSGIRLPLLLDLPFFHLHFHSLLLLAYSLISWYLYSFLLEVNRLA